jgi:thiamine monophosphate synthase
VIVVLTDRRLARRPLPEVVEAALAGGAARIILRERTMEYAQRRALAHQLRRIAGDRLVVAGPDPLGGAAVHLAAADPLVMGGLVGRSCHDAAELGRLSTEDYVTLSPMYPTATKPGYGPALTPSGAAALRSPVPWLALGGVTSPARAAECAAVGAAGVAVLGAVMRADDPAAVVRSLLAGFRSGRPAPAGPGGSALARPGGRPRVDGGARPRPAREMPA